MTANCSVKKIIAFNLCFYLNYVNLFRHIPTGLHRLDAWKTVFGLNAKLIDLAVGASIRNHGTWNKDQVRINLSTYDLGKVWTHTVLLELSIVLYFLVLTKWTIDIPLYYRKHNHFIEHPKVARKLLTSLIGVSLMERNFL